MREFESHRLLESLTDGAYLVDRDGYLAAGNAAWLARLDMDAEQVIGRHIKDVFWDVSFSRQCEAGQSEDDETGACEQEQAAALETLQSGQRTARLSRDRRFCLIGYPVTDERGAVTHALMLTVPAAGGMAAEVRDTPPSQEAMIGVSPAMEQVRTLIREVAMTDTTIMLVGETGVGKEVVATEIQRASARAAAPFIRINCAAIPENLLESELFGHDSGAFTGAARRGKAGLLELASGGTILLDEIGEMALSMQPKLLRAIQERSIFRVGGGTLIPIDVRIIAATNRDLTEMVRRKQFREDLYYRLNVIPIHVPPLRERGEDVVLLAEAFLAQFNAKYSRSKTFSRAARCLLQNYDWPGNIRELRNLVERLTVLGGTPQISAEDVRRLLTARFVAEGETERSLKESVEHFERGMIEAALARYGSTYKAASALGTSQSTLARKVRQLGIRVN